MFRPAFVISVFAVSIAAEVERGERLLLHSDVDTATAIQMLTSQVDNLNAQYGQLNAQYGQLSAENAQLRTDVNNITSQNTQLLIQNAQLTSDMASLKTQLTASRSKGEILLFFIIGNLLYSHCKCIEFIFLHLKNVNAAYITCISHYFNFNNFDLKFKFSFIVCPSF